MLVVMYVKITKLQVPAIHAIVAVLVVPDMYADELLHSEMQKVKMKMAIKELIYVVLPVILTN